MWQSSPPPPLSLWKLHPPLSLPPRFFIYFIKVSYYIKSFKEKHVLIDSCLTRENLKQTLHPLHICIEPYFWHGSFWHQRHIFYHSQNVVYSILQNFHDFVNQLVLNKSKSWFSVSVSKLTFNKLKSFAVILTPAKSALKRIFKKRMFITNQNHILLVTYTCLADIIAGVAKWLCF